MMSDKYRVLIVSSSYLPVVGGMQMVAHNLAKQLTGFGHDVRVVTNRYPRSLGVSEEMDGVKIDRLLLLRPELGHLRRSRPDLFLASLYFYPRSYQKLRALVRSFQPDVVNVHYPDHQTPFVLKLRREFRFRLVVSLHGYDVGQVANGNGNGNGKAALNSVHARELRAILNAADAVTACSDHLMRKAIQVEPGIVDKSHVLQNGIDPARFCHKQAYSHPRRYVLALGRLTQNKGFDMLVQAFARRRKLDDLDLIIAGEGEEGEALSAQVKQLNLTDRVHFFGQASPDEVVKLLNGCSGVAVPSRSESFGITALEAIAAGKPVLATKIGGLQEFLRELTHSGNGQSMSRPNVILVEPSVEGISEGLGQLFNRPDQTAAAKEFRLPQNYTWPHVARQYERVFRGN